MRSSRSNPPTTATYEEVEAEYAMLHDTSPPNFNSQLVPTPDEGETALPQEETQRLPTAVVTRSMNTTMATRYAVVGEAKQGGVPPKPTAVDQPGKGKVKDIYLLTSNTTDLYCCSGWPGQEL